ncbi:glycine-rich domain-containing protein [Escherichia coli]|uniref:glycine-rich domain-containing protein n=2 Tax=Escherichia coli TaxID=562 RepID=UPI0032AF164F
MAKNDFKAFATDRNANVMSQEEWEALPALLSGFTAGKASSAQVNKVIRQASFITAALAQYTANKSGLDVLDDGDLNGFISKMEAALGKDFQALDATLTALAGLATAADKLPYFTGNDTASLTTLTNVGRDILAKTSKQEVIHYLGLGDTSGYVGRRLSTRAFASSGTYTPSLETKRIRVTITGGGGGGGGCQAISSNETFFGAGGGAGGTVITILTPTQNSYPVTIGAGGAGGVGATNGLKGGDSSFGSVIAPGGEGGGKSGVTNTNGGNGGVPNIGDIRITGGDGGDGQSGNIGVSGEGGASYWGGGGRAGAGGGVRGRAFGSGGGGAYDAGYSGTSMTGGKGAAGVCIIEEFA